MQNLVSALHKKNQKVAADRNKENLTELLAK
jgi:hypothetical protein